MTLVKIEKILFFCSLLFLSTQLGKHFFFDFSLIYSLKIDYFAPTLYFWDLLVTTLFILAFLNKTRLKIGAVNLLFLFLLSQSFSLILAQNIGAGLFRLEQYLITGLFGVYIASQKFENIKNIVLRALATGVIVESLLAFGQFIFGKTLGLWILGERTFTILTPYIARFDFFGQVFLRPYGTFPHPNVLAAFMVLILPLIVFLKPKSLMFLTVVALAEITIFLSFSRPSILLGLIELLAFVRIKIRILIIPLLIVAPFILIRFLSVFNFDSLSLIRREELASIALDYFWKSPIFGIGLNNFINQLAASTLLAGPSRFLQPAHNIYLLLISETGVVGFFGFLILTFYPVFYLYKNRKKNLSKIFLFCWGIIFFLGLFDHYFLTLAQGQRLFFLIWGLSFIQEKV